MIAVASDTGVDCISFSLVRTVVSATVMNLLLSIPPSSSRLMVRSRFHMMELRRDDVRHFAGQYTHHLKKAKDGYRIKLQRVDMTNAQAAYDYVLQVWV